MNLTNISLAKDWNVLLTGLSLSWLFELLDEGVLPEIEDFVSKIKDEIYTLISYEYNDILLSFCYRWSEF